MSLGNLILISTTVFMITTSEEAPTTRVTFASDTQFVLQASLPIPADRVEETILQVEEGSVKPDAEIRQQVIAKRTEARRVSCMVYKHKNKSNSLVVGRALLLLSALKRGGRDWLF